MSSIWWVANGGDRDGRCTCVCVRQTMKNEQAICLINFLNITIALVSTASRDPAFAGRSEAGNVFEFELDLMSWAIRRHRVERSRRAAGNLWSALEFLLIDVAPKKQDTPSERTILISASRWWLLTCGVSRLTLITGGKRGSVAWGCWTWNEASD